MTPAGFFHSEIPGSKPACGSPRLIAACHVLLRLSAPRRPPYTLSSLTKSKRDSSSGTGFLSRILGSLLWIRFSCQRTVDREIRAAHAHRKRATRIVRISTCPKSHRDETREASKPPGGADRPRTDDLRLAKAALSQLSYSPGPLRAPPLVGLGRFELPTSRLSGVRSDQLSYRPRPGVKAFAAPENIGREQLDSLETE